MIKIFYIYKCQDYNFFPFYFFGYPWWYSGFLILVLGSGNTPNVDGGGAYYGVSEIESGLTAYTASAKATTRNKFPVVRLKVEF